MKKDKIYIWWAILILVLWAITIPLIFIWYDWKLLVILVMFGWANNAQNMLNRYKNK